MKISEEIVDSAHFRKKRGRLLLPTLLLVCLACCAISSQIGASVVATSVSSEDNIYNLDDFDDDDDDDDDDDPVIFSEKNNKDTAFDQEDEDRDGERGSERVLTPPEIIVVVAVDGTVAGISKETGQILWKQSEKTAASSSSSSSYIKPSTSSKTLLEEASYILRPLVSTTTTTKSASLASYTAVPSVDGTVYTTTNDVTTSTSVKELVARAPFLDDGRFFVGSRQSSAAALDGETGQILRVVKNTQDEDERSASSLPTLDDRNVVWIGRVDNLITVQDARTGMVDAKFSVAEIMSVADMHGMMGKEAWKSKQVIRPNSSSRRDSDDDSGGEDDDFSKSEQNHMIYPRLGLPASDTTSSLSSTATATFEYTSALIATPNGNVALRDFDDDNKLTWVADESFDSPIVFAIDAVTGSVMGVDIIPDVPDSDASLDDITKEMERQSDIVSLDDTPIVGAMSNGQLYALPLRRNMDAVTGKATSSATVIASTSSAAASSSNGAKHITQLVSQLPGRPNANFQHSDNSNNQHQQQFINQQQNHDHNPTGRHGTLAAKKSCVSSSPTFPSCLIKNPSDHKISSEAVPPLGNGANLISGKHQRQFQQHEQSDASLAVMTSQFHKEDDGGFHHPQYGYVSPQDLGGFYHPEYGYVSPRDLYGTKNRTHKNSYQKFFRVLGSWLPPTIALLFVVSFELGRRKRLNDERERQDSILKVERDDKINGVLSTADKLDGEQQTSDQSRQQEVISVSEDVLGYGGHGTVVYKGVLEGRNVAVKRMLKAYHASADREISLLIESDGDPNVVRYFLKEVRGDFVYLALELCDLSLHELIAILRVNQHQTKSVLSDAEEGTCDFSSESMDAIVRILLQIASGVKHLHSLRIVHRDLKPANILLAISKRGKKKRKDEDSIFVNFAHNYYDAKISDMGLGKQLMGQSSIGASLVGESSFRGSKIGVSSIGVGPGSVGWQAPEVMALRLTSDSSARSTDSVSNATDSKEHQPADLQPSARTSRSVDIFSLGCIFYSVLIPGCHPFGEWFEREANIMHNRPKLDPLKIISIEAFYLIRSMLDRNPRLRPTSKEVCQHPFFWDSQKKLAFLCDFSDRLETDFLTQTQNSSNTINSLAIERSALDVIGTSWEAKLDSALIDNVQKFRTYDYSCIRDLLRLIRNKHHHFEELPEEFRLTTAPNQNALCEYFAVKFPALVMHCYLFCGRNLPDDDPLVLKFDITPAKFDTKHIPTAPTSVIVAKKSLPSAAETNSTHLTRPEISSGESKIDSIEGTSSESTDAVTNDTDNKSDADIIVWEGSIAAKTFNCRGWSRSQDEWSRHIEPFYKKRDPASKRCLEDPKFRTRLCNHWDTSLGTFCPMKKKNKCVFAHGPAELRVKEGKRNRWGKLVDKKGNNSNTWHSGGEDSFGAAFSIEKVRKEEGKWNGSKDKKTTGTTPRKKKYGTNQGKQKVTTKATG